MVSHIEGTTEETEQMTLGNMMMVHYWNECGK